MTEKTELSICDQLELASRFVANFDGLEQGLHSAEDAIRLWKAWVSRPSYSAMARGEDAPTAWEKSCAEITDILGYSPWP